MDCDHTLLISLLTELKENQVLEEVKKLLDSGDTPLHILEGCQEGMKYVGENYVEGQYYLSGLIMAGEIMRQVAELLQPVLENSVRGDSSGRILLGTVQGDIHDIGKNFVKILLNCSGFDVLDLGVDVAPSDFLDHTLRHNPDIIGISALLTVSYDSLHETISLLRKTIPAEKGFIPIIIGGGVINESVRKQVGADYWAPNALEGVKICQRLVSETDPPHMVDMQS